MPNKRLLFISTGILLVTTLIVGMFGVVPLPEYDLFTYNSNFEGKVIYHVEIQTENIIPPAPDILDNCIFYIDLSEKPIEEKKIICNSDLYDYSYEIYFYDAAIYEQDSILLKFWDSQSDNERKGLLVNIETGQITDKLTLNLSNYEINKMNVYGEKLIEPWETSDYESRLIGIYYVNRTETIEVFSSKAPTNYYYESLHWSPDGNSIIAGDSENNLIIFSKNKTSKPRQIDFENLQIEMFNNDKGVLVDVLGWTD
jgi:WD40 repeat protein